MQKVLSVSIAAYNAEGWLARCIDSLIVPEVLNELEIIIVNDGSSDRTLEIAKAYEEKYPESIIVIDKPNGGHGSTINASKRIATGKYFKVVDADDWVDKDGIIDLVNNLRFIDVDAVYNPYRVFLKDKDEYIDKTSYFKLKEDKSVIRDPQEMEGLSLSMHCFVFRTEIVRKSRDLDEDCFYVDVEYVIYNCGMSRSLLALDKHVYVYYIGREGQSVDVNVMFNRRNQHLKVCSSVLDYYINSRDKSCIFDGSIHNRIVALLIKQYKLLFINKDKRQAKKELYEYDEFIKKIDKSLYNQIVHTDLKFTKALFVMRILKFNGFSIFSLLIRKKVVRTIRNSY